MTAQTRERRPGQGGASDDQVATSITADCRPDRRQSVSIARLVIDLAQVLPLVDGHLDDARFAEVEARIVHAVATLIGGGR